MDSIADLLKHRPVPSEPQESRLLKSYVEQRYQITPKIELNEHHITLIVPNAALAGSLRLELPTLLKTCKITKKLHIRIS